MKSKHDDGTVKIPPRTINPENRKLLINRVENLVISIIKQITSEKSGNMSELLLYMESKTKEEWPKSMEKNEDDLNDETFATCSSRQVFSGEMEEEEEAVVRGINHEGALYKRGKAKLAVMMTVAAKAHKLLIVDEYQTRRSLYYELKGGPLGEFIHRQETVDATINNVAQLLQCTTWDLGFIATAKGLVAGNLTLRLETGDIVDCRIPGGVLIPQITTNVVSIESRASSIIIIEKDAVFQKLLDENCPERLNCVLVTGKGYPDVSTRSFIKMLTDCLKIPSYILVDADPYGIDIMLVYKYGSASLYWEREYLACPEIKWIGIYPSEIDKINIQALPLTEYDLMKLNSLKQRPCLDEKLHQELRILEGVGKAEIEAAAEFSISFLTSLYLPLKIS